MRITRKPGLPSVPAASPTAQAYGELQSAYDHFNAALFHGKLPPCLITLQRKGRRTLGFYAPKRFATSAGETTDEIALNPRHFKHQSAVGVCAVLVHEMVHLWQQHFGRPSRSNYHNREWAGEMLRLGLRPSDTGKPGGRMTGQAMSHYVIPGGPFEVTARDLLASRTAISWFDADALVLLPQGLDEFLFSPPRSGRRTKFQCPDCPAQAWGKSSLNLVCGDCDRPMMPLLS